MPKKSTTRRSRGRPAHVPTTASRRRVSVLAGAGMRHVDIALGLGIDRDTLAKHYGHELSVAAALRRAEVLVALHKAATGKGSVTAAKAYLAVEPEACAPPPEEGERPAAPAPAPAPAAQAPVASPVAQPKGKKEQAKADAVTAAAGTEWADLLPAHTLPQ